MCACVQYFGLWKSFVCSGRLYVYCSTRGRAYRRLNDHGLSEVCLPLYACAVHWKSSLTVFLCLSFSLCLWEKANRGAAFMRQKSPLPLKLPALLFSCTNSTAIKLSWLVFRKHLRREGVGGIAVLPPTPPLHPPCLLPSGYHRSMLLLTTLNKELTSFLFS